MIWHKFEGIFCLWQIAIYGFAQGILMSLIDKPLIWTRMIYASFSMLSRLLSTIGERLFESSFLFSWSKLFYGFAKILSNLKQIFFIKKKIYKYLVFLAVVYYKWILLKAFCPKYGVFSPFGGAVLSCSIQLFWDLHSFALSHCKIGSFLLD